MKSSNRFKVKTIYLLLIAALVWGAAGINILIIGIREYIGNFSVVNLILSVAVFIVFETFIFRRLVKKHTARINCYTEETQHFWKFFDVKSFIIMAAMITLGVVLRNTPAVPRVFIAVFYVGIGCAILTAGILFAAEYVKAYRNKTAL